MWIKIIFNGCVKHNLIRNLVFFKVFVEILPNLVNIFDSALLSKNMNWLSLSRGTNKMSEAASAEIYWNLIFILQKLATDVPLSNLGIQKVDVKFTEGPRYMAKTIKSFKMVERPQEKFPKFDWIFDFIKKKSTKWPPFEKLKYEEISRDLVIFC